MLVFKELSGLLGRQLAGPLMHGLWGTEEQRHLFQENMGSNAKFLEEQRQYWGRGKIRVFLLAALSPQAFLLE